MTTPQGIPAGLTPAQEAKVRADFDALQKLIDEDGWAVVTALFPLPPGAPESQRLYLHYTVGMSSYGLHELCLQSRTVQSGQLLIALLGRTMLAQPSPIPLDEGDQLRVENMEPLTVRYHQNLRPFTQVTMRYTFPRMVELVAPGGPVSP